MAIKKTVLRPSGTKPSKTSTNPIADRKINKTKVVSSRKPTSTIAPTKTPISKASGIGSRVVANKSGAVKSASGMTKKKKIY